MSDVAATHVTIEPEPPELQERNLWVATRLLVSSTIFLFVPFVFAYVYLAALDTAAMWRPPGVQAPIGWGIAVLACAVVSAGLVAWARAELASKRSSTSRLLLGLGLVAGIAGVVVQVLEFWHIGFGPKDGGFASVFVGWSLMYALVLLFTMIWLETILVSAIRNGFGSPGSGRSELDGIVFFLVFYAGLGALSFMFLYLL